MTGVLFGQSYYLCFDPKLWQAQEPYPPMGTLFAASFMRQKGYAVALFDAMLAPSTAGWEAALRRQNPRFAVLFEDNFNYLSKMCLLRMREAAFAMCAAAKKSGATVIVCGPDATDHAPQYFDAGAAFVIHGEGEATLGELLDHLSGKNALALEQIRGLSYLQAPGQIKRTPPRPNMADLDALPMPAWDLVDIERYRHVWFSRHHYFSLNMVTTRGCPYRCNWCAKPTWGHRYQARSPENVFQELLYLRRYAQPDHIWFMDDIFGLKPGWIEEFSDLVQRHHVVTAFKCLLRADLVQESTAFALKRAGCATVWMGVESGSQKILDAMDKNLILRDIEAATHCLKAQGIRAGFFIQFGYPGETYEDIRATIRMLRRLEPDELGISVSYPLPGTPFYERVKSDLGLKQNWTDSDDLAMLYKGPYPTYFYRRLHQFVHQDMALRRSWTRLLKTWRGLSRQAWRCLAAVLWHSVRWLPARLRLALALRYTANGRSQYKTHA